MNGPRWAGELIEELNPDNLIPGLALHIERTYIKSDPPTTMEPGKRKHCMTC